MLNFIDLDWQSFVNAIQNWESILSCNPIPFSHYSNEIDYFLSMVIAHISIVSD